MPTKRWLTAVVCSGRSLVVAGGKTEIDKYLSTVEVMDTETLHWSTASSLPHPLYTASATLCGGQVYMLGGFDQRDKLGIHLLTGCPPPVLPTTVPGSMTEDFVIS